MALNYADLQALVLALAEKHHAGAIYPMAEKTGLSPATMDKWAKGNVKNPEITSAGRSPAWSPRWGWPQSVWFQPRQEP